MKTVTLKQVIEIVNSSIYDTPEKTDNNNILLVDETMTENDLTQFGMDSISFIKMIVSLEEVFECQIPDEKLLLTEMNTTNKIIDVLRKLEYDNNENHR